MPTNTKQVDFTKPFKFCAYEGTFRYTCKGLNEDGVLVIAVQSGENLPCSLESAKRFIANGDWKPILTNKNTQQEDAMTKLEDYIKAINKNVPEAAKEGCEWCECPGCKEVFAQEQEDSPCGFCDRNPEDCDCGEYDGSPQEALLDAIKDFTLSTGASVFINEGTYEVHCFGLNSPFKADNDHNMINLMEAIIVLEGAM
jgi:hypothetical protein